MRKSAHAIGARSVEGLLCALVIALTVGLLTVPLPWAFLPALGLFFLLALLRYPELGYYAIIFLVPFGAYRQLGGPSGLRIHWIIAFGLLLTVFLRQATIKSALVNIRSSLWPPLLLFVPIALISAMLSPYRDPALHNLILMLVAYAFFALNLLFISRNGFLQTLPSVLIWSVSINSFLAVLEHFFGFSVLGGQAQAGLAGRATGATTDPNQMSLQVTYVIPFLFHWTFLCGPGRRRLVGFPLLVLNLGGLVSTESRGGSLVLVVLILAILFENRSLLRPRHVGLFVCMAAALMALALVLIPNSYWERQKTVTDPADRSIGRRTSYLYVAWDAFKSRPIQGWGPGAFIEIYSQTDVARRYSRTDENIRRYAHNTYVEVLVGTGILGLAIFLAVMWRAWRDFSLAKATALSEGNEEMATLFATYRLSFASLLMYLMMLSDFENKYLWLALAVSQVAARVALEAPARNHHEPARSA